MSADEDKVKAATDLIADMSTEEKAKLMDLLHPVKEELQNPGAGAQADVRPRVPQADGSQWKHHPGALRMASQFSGDNNKGDVPFEIWQQEVQALKATGAYTDAEILIAIRKSLKGLAAEVLLHLGPNATSDVLLKKMENTFGNVLPIDKLLEKFWSAKQTDGESVTAWACRLEHLVSQIRSRDASIFPEGSSSMLRTKFWSGLREERMKNALRHLMDTDCGYDQVMISARVAELETGKIAAAKQATEISSQESKKMDEMFKLLQKMDERLVTVEQDYRNRGSSRGRGFGQYTRGQRGRGTRGNFRGGDSTFQGADRSNNLYRYSEDGNNFQGFCFRCKQRGHKKSNCPLNS